MTWDHACRTGKQRYSTMADARKAMKGLKDRHKKVRFYRCKECGNGWHMTHYLHETRDKKVARTMFKRGTR